MSEIPQWKIAIVKPTPSDILPKPILKYRTEMREGEFFELFNKMLTVLSTINLQLGSITNELRFIRRGKK